MAYWGNEPAKVAVKVGANVITTTEIQDGQVYTADILDDAITAQKVDDDGTGFRMGSLGLGGAVSGDEKLTVTGTASFSGAITGNLTGNASGTSATVTGGTQASITSAANLVTVGTIGTGVWNGTAVASAYLDADTAHLSTAQTFSGNKTFSGTLTVSESNTNHTTLGRIYTGKHNGDYGEIGEGYYISSNTAKYKYSDTATRLYMGANAFNFYGAAAGTADNNITWVHKMILDGNGKCGIGTSSPETLVHISAGDPGVAPHSDVKLCVEDDAGVTISTLAPDNSWNGFQMGSASDSTGAILQWNYNNKQLYLGTTPSTDGGLITFHTGTGTERMRIGSTGNIGIGNAYSSAPSNVLQIQDSGASGLVKIYSTTGAVSNSENILEIRSDDTSSPSSYNLIKANVNGYNKFSVDGDGQMTVVGNVMLSTQRNLYFDGGSNTYIKEDNDDKLYFYTGGNNTMTIGDHLELTGNITASRISTKQDQKGTNVGTQNVMTPTNGTFGIAMACRDETEQSDYELCMWTKGQSGNGTVVDIKSSGETGFGFSGDVLQFTASSSRPWNISVTVMGSR